MQIPKYKWPKAERAYIEFCELTKKPIESLKDKQRALYLLKKLFDIYWKLLQMLLREKKIVELYPRNIIPLAINEELVDKSAIVWLEFIDMVNVLLYSKKIDESKQIDKIIEKYHDKTFDIHSFLKKYMDLSLTVSSKQEDIVFPRNKPEYKAEELGIYENSYNFLIDFFKKNSEIKYVWLHGSRAKGNALLGSDIDILIDCNMDIFSKMESMMDVLRIPYRIDATNIHDKTKFDFLAGLSKHLKIIYRKEDFQ